MGLVDKTGKVLLISQMHTYIIFVFDRQQYLDLNKFHTIISHI